MTKIWVIENVLQLEKIAHNASWRNFILRILRKRVFQQPLLAARKLAYTGPI